jgi:hypothetical protein
VKVTGNFLATSPPLERVIFVGATDEIFAAYRELL